MIQTLVGDLEAMKFVFTSGEESGGTRLEDVDLFLKRQATQPHRASMHSARLFDRRGHKNTLVLNQGNV